MTSEQEPLTEQWEYYVANVELQEIGGRYEWVSSVGKETIIGLSPVLAIFVIRLFYATNEALRTSG